ncbi:acyltransferas-like protein [Hyaloscypha variabilis F]|uniref:Acyltransferas-like protein n=1 Tax=Hyaloscypha variabilis (strain UAMH 11265 / GT02V1 / F) TaxID=1149755 RepID=A0A2J6RV68_HYAVF|nr:acyltransferas-like protein [Hyaloscypha variabilis F]
MSRPENVKWVDGLRGFASVLVIATHITRAFFLDLMKPASHEGLPPKLFQYPFLRVLTQGRIGVAIFALVTGYVCALKPIRQVRGGDRNGMFNSVAKSAFRRVPRLILPTVIATILSWFICQLGFYRVAQKADSWWLNFSAPGMSPNIGRAIYSLLLELITTWTKGWNNYDHHTWTMLPLLKSSMLVFTFLISTAYCQTRYRMMVALALFVYFYASNESTFGMLPFFGVFLSDLSQDPGHQSWCNARKWPGRILSPILIVAGLYISSYPEAEPTWMPWSNVMLEWSHYIFPGGCETDRYYTALGLILIALGIHFSNAAKTFLSSKYLLWFGKHSFAVYLLHGSLLRWILAWMYFGVRLPGDIIVEGGGVQAAPNLQICGRFQFWALMPIWIGIVYLCAYYWTKYVDPWCARTTEKLVKYVFEEPQMNLDAEKRLLPQ